MTMSTSGYIILIILMSNGIIRYWNLISNKQIKKVLFVLIPIVLTAIIYGVLHSSVIVNKFEKSNYSLLIRKNDIFAGISLIFNRPILGYGYGTRKLSLAFSAAGIANISSGLIGESISFGIVVTIILLILVITNVKGNSRYILNASVIVYLISNMSEACLFFPIMLLKVAETEFKHPYFFQNALTDQQFFIGYSRLRNSETTGIIKWNSDPNYNNGIYIDIYVLDGYTESKEKLNRQIAERNIVQKLCKLYYYKPSNEPNIRDTLLCIGKRVLSKIVSYDFLVSAYDRILQRYSNSTNRVTMMTEDIKWLDLYWCDIDDLRYITRHKYEMIEVNIPQNYDEILRHMYGDYMIYPPIEKRGVWHEDWLLFDPEVSYKKYFENLKRRNDDEK